MKIALLGYGKMGKMIEQLSAGSDAAIAASFDIDTPLRDNDASRDLLSDVDVLIDFSTPEAVVGNIKTSVKLQKNIVVGTTGWSGQIEHVRKLVENSGIGLVYGSNFSLGVNLFYRISEYAGRLMKSFDEFDPFIIEAHHKFKKDAPSGTALTLKSKVAAAMEKTEIPVNSIRAGYIPGSHTLGFDSMVDTLKLSHIARSREGFARGALLAAKWITGKKGFFEFSEVLDSIIS